MDAGVRGDHSGGMYAGRRGRQRMQDRGDAGERRVRVVRQKTIDRTRALRGRMQDHGACPATGEPFGESGVGEERDLPFPCRIERADTFDHSGGVATQGEPEPDRQLPEGDLRHRLRGRRVRSVGRARDQRPAGLAAAGRDCRDCSSAGVMSMACVA